MTDELQPGGNLREFVGDWTPVFADPERQYDFLDGVTGHREVAGGAEFDMRTNGGRDAHASVVFVTPEVVRVRAWLDAAPPEGSPMLVKDALRTAAVKITTDDEAVTIASKSVSVRVTKGPWSVEVRDGDGRAIFHETKGDRALMNQVTIPTGFSNVEGGAPQFHETFSLEPGEHLYGLGEQFAGFDKNGQRLVAWSRDPTGSVVNTISYLNIPFLLSTRGYGLFVHQHSKIVWELGNPAVQSGAFRTGDPYLDYFVIHGPSFKDVISRYGDLTGRPTVPPVWSFGAWYSRCMYRSREQVEGIVERLRELDIPADVVHLDPLWQETRNTRTLDGMQFVWDEEAFPDQEGFVKWLAERGFKLSLWEIPYVYDKTEMYDEGIAKGYFATTADGGLAKPLDGEPGAALPDFTNPDAVKWWQDKHRPYLKAGVAAFKTDYAEATPTDAVFSDGRTGEQVHNLYPLLYNKAVYEVMKDEGVEPMLFGRSGYAGSQRYPINWTGDAPCTWGGMAATLRAGLGLSLSGISMWSHDIGGFWNPDGLQPPDPTLYIRWAQFGLLSSHARFHGVRGREPWYFGDKAVEVVRDFSKLRYRLLPYLYSLAHEAAATGMPVVRPLVLEYQDDPVAPMVDYEYLLGPDMLVVPVMNDDGKVLVYLPEGVWCDWWTGERIPGHEFLRLNVPIEQVPLYVREGSIIPLAPEMDYVGQKAWDPLTLDVRLAIGDEGTTRVATPNGTVDVSAERHSKNVRTSVRGPAQDYELRLMDISIPEPSVEGDAEIVESESYLGGTRVLVRGRGEWTVVD
jgi:alpha-D-xyloside xylohydrolase